MEIFTDNTVFVTSAEHVLVTSKRPVIGLKEGRAHV